MKGFKVIRMKPGAHMPNAESLSAKRYAEAINGNEKILDIYRNASCRCLEYLYKHRGLVAVCGDGKLQGFKVRHEN